MILTGRPVVASGRGSDPGRCSARVALPRLEQVRSPRNTALLGTLAQELRRRKRNQGVADLLPDLVNALARQTA
jgi:hypothetical protein